MRRGGRCTRSGFRDIAIFADHRCAAGARNGRTGMVPVRHRISMRCVRLQRCATCQRVSGERWMFSSSNSGCRYSDECTDRGTSYHDSANHFRRRTPEQSHPDALYGSAKCVVVTYDKRGLPLLAERQR